MVLGRIFVGLTERSILFQNDQPVNHLRIDDISHRYNFVRSLLDAGQILEGCRPSEMNANNYHIISVNASIIR